MSNCVCNVCTRYKRFAEIVKQVDIADVEFLWSILDSLDNAENSSAYYKAIVQNKWPGSEDILATYRRGTSSGGPR